MKNTISLISFILICGTSHGQYRANYSDPLETEKITAMSDQLSQDLESIVLLSPYGPKRKYVRNYRKKNGILWLTVGTASGLGLTYLSFHLYWADEALGVVTFIGGAGLTVFSITHGIIQLVKGSNGGYSMLDTQDSHTAQSSPYRVLTAGDGIGFRLQL